jgi:hypothetical protein
LASTIAVILSPAAEAAKNEKAKPAAAKKKAAPSPSDIRKTKKAGKAVVASPPPAASQAWEAPPKDDITKTPLPPPPVETKPVPAAAPSAAPAAAPAAAPPAAPAAAPPAESAAAPSEPQPSAPTPPEEETMPVLVPPPPPQYVEHLGPSAYPGRLRGLYGGSLWLEPSFHGLQWPYMTRTGVGVSGSVWVDSGYEKITSENPGEPKIANLLQHGRAVLRVTPIYVSGRFFIQGQVELVGNGCQSADRSMCDQSEKGTVDVDDLWLRIGQWNVWDLKVGRFEGWEIYHTGMGLDINTLERRGAWQTVTGPGFLPAPQYYGVNYMHDRPRGMGLGYAALHFYPLSVLRFELLGELGTDDAADSSAATAAAAGGTTTTAAGGNNVWGARPSAIFDLGWLKLKAGAEYQSVTASMQMLSNGAFVDDKTETTKLGVGAAFQLVFDPYVEFGGNIGWGDVKQKDASGDSDSTGSYTTTSVGGFANVRLGRRGSGFEDLLLGGGANWTTQYYSHKVANSDADYTAHLQIFGAVQYLIAKQLFVKAVIAYARADIWPSGQPDSLANAMWSGRIRLMYLY